MGTITINLPAKPLFLLIGVVVLGTLLGTFVGTRLSAQGGSNGDIVHLCVNNRSGETQVIGPGDTCRRNWSRVDVKGVPGAAIDAMVHPVSPDFAERFGEITGRAIDPSDADDVLARLDEANVDKGVIQALGFFGAFVSDDAEVSVENDFVADEAAKSGRLIGFCGINPLFDGALVEIDRCFADLGMVGIKLNPPFSGMDLANPDHVDALSAVFQKAQALDAPVQLHTQTPDDPPMAADAFANLAGIIAAHPDVRVSHSHCGGVVDARTADQWLESMRPNPDSAFLDLSICLNSFADAPFSQRELVVRQLRQWGLDQLIWSSDYVKFRLPTPLTPQEARDALEKYPFTQAEINFIVSGEAAAAWLGDGP